MQITLFTANCTGVKTNCIYPNKVVAESKAEMVEAIKRDHVCAKYTNNYRSNDNFEEAVGIFMDNERLPSRFRVLCYGLIVVLPSAM